MKGTQYTNKSDYLRRGDVLCTSVKGHTVVVLTNGSKSGAAVTAKPDVIKYGDKGSDVKEIQNLLIAAGYEIVADGDFGEETLKAVKSFQNAYGITVDGIIGEKTLTALKAVQSVKTVVVTGGTVNVRKGAGTKYSSVGTVKKGNEFKYLATASNGWYKILRNGEECYISNKYSKIK
jgi:peptidoglycan hydrolase-like protein with peptidoglycan-binding domain